MRRRLALATLAAGAAASALPFTAAAQSRPLRFVVPYPPGGPLDIVARALAERVKDSLGVVIVENRPGAGGNLGADAVAKSPPDGSTIVMGAVATHAINPWLYARLPYDPIRDFTPITGVAQVPNVLVMSPEMASRLGIASVADLVAYAGKNPGKLNYGSGGNGSAGHLAGEMFKAQAGVFMVHIGSSELKARLASLFAEAMASPPERFAAFVKSELGKYEKVVKASGARIE